MENTHSKKGRSRTTKRKITIRDMSADTQTLLQQQHIKAKQLLKQWKIERATEKKTRIIARKQARDISRGEKQRFSEMDEGADHYVWKHPGCNDECIADNCQEYMLEYLCSYA